MSRKLVCLTSETKRQVGTLDLDCTLYTETVQHDTTSDIVTTAATDTDSTCITLLIPQVLCGMISLIFSSAPSDAPGSW